MNKYEIALVISTRLEEDAKNEVLEKVKRRVSRAGGTITNIDDWGKKRMAYEIQKMKDGYYYFIQLEADSEAPAKLEANLRIMESVIRYLVVKQDAE
jgi:small subunit ribosomal protein S6